jgi:PilZ domain-containing protein
MKSRDDELIVRKYQRHDLVLPVSISIAPEHQTVVRFSPTVCVRDGWVPATLTDFSPGGLGFMVDLYLPRRCLLRIRVTGLDESDDESVLDLKTRVQRIRMTDRRPAFLVGTSYEDLSDMQLTAVEALSKQLDSQDST